MVTLIQPSEYLRTFGKKKMQWNISQTTIGLAELSSFCCIEPKHKTCFRAQQYCTPTKTDRKQSLHSQITRQFSDELISSQIVLLSFPSTGKHFQKASDSEFWPKQDVDISSEITTPFSTFPHSSPIVLSNWFKQKSQDLLRYMNLDPHNGSD